MNNQMMNEKKTTVETTYFTYCNKDSEYKRIMVLMKNSTEDWLLTLEIYLVVR